MSYFLGVDGGQSHTVAVIGDETGRIRGRGVAGPCNHVGGPAGKEKFLAALQTSLGEACRAAGLDPARIRFTAACLGFSGGPEDKQELVRGCVPADLIKVTHDAEVALVAATGGEPGVVVIAGTGSMAFGRNRQGRTARAGGWGYVFGDEGGAFDLTRQALRAALRYEEGWGPPTSLRERLLQATGAKTANELLHRFYTTEFTRPQIAELSRLVHEAAACGDTIALACIHQAAQQLAELAAAVRSQLFSPDEDVLVSYSGGVFQSELLRARFKQLVELNPANKCVDPRYEPAWGALIEAYRLAGLNLQPAG